MILQQRKIILISLISILIIFLGFLGYNYYCNSQRVNDPTPPILYTLDFSGKNIQSNIQEGYLDSNYDPLVIGLAWTGIDTQNIKNISVSYKPANDTTRVLNYNNIIGYQDHFYYFFLPKIIGEYLFDVNIEYYDGHTIKSSDYFSGPILTIRPEPEQRDQGIITLRTNKTHVSVGEQVSFEVLSKAQFNNEEYQKNQSILWDLDGNDINDIGTIKNTRTYKYMQSGIYRPKVTVLYNGHPSIAYGDEIFVQ